MGAINPTLYGDVTPRTAAYVQKQLLRRALPHLVLEAFGQGKPVPLRSTENTVFRKYHALDTTPMYLQEGVTPTTQKKLTHTDISVTLPQIGDSIGLTDRNIDTHEDPIFQEAVDILGEQAGQMIERIRWGILGAGVNVYYANGGARADVNTVFTRKLQRMATKFLKAQNASMFTNVIRSTPEWGRQAVKGSYIGLCHTNVEHDIRDAQSFKHYEDYGHGTPYTNEIGAIEEVRWLCSTIFTPFDDAGGAAAGVGGVPVDSAGGAQADVYPTLIIARDAYGIVPLKGRAALTPMVVFPKPSDSDPFAQRGHISWKARTTAVILQDIFMVRMEVATTI